MKGLAMVGLVSAGLLVLCVTTTLAVLFFPLCVLRSIVATAWADADRTEDQVATKFRARLLELQSTVHRKANG